MKISKVPVHESALEEHPDAYLLFERGRLSFANRAAQRVFGAVRGRRLMGRSLNDLIDVGSAHAIKSWERQAEIAGWSLPIRVQCLALDGRPFWVIALARVEGAGPQARMHLVLQRPIHAEASPERHRGLTDDFDRAESLGQLGRFALQHTTAEHDWFSDGFARIVGRDPAREIITRQAYLGEIVHADDRAPVELALEAAFAEERDLDLEHRIVRPDGSTRNVRCVCVPNRGRDGGALVLRGTLHDVTDLVRVSGQLEHQGAWLAAILESAVEGIITIDANGIMQSANRAAERVFGYSSAELRGCNVSMLMPPVYSREHDRYLHNYLVTGEKKIIGIGREVVGLRKDGSTFPMELAVSEVRLGDQRMFTGFVHDISQRKQLEADFLHSQKTEVVGRLAEGIAHDFNNLLMGIRSCASLARGELAPLTSDGAVLPLIEEIENATHRGMALTRRLSAFSRNKPSHLVPVRLSEVIAANSSMFRHLIGEDIELVIDAPDGRVAADTILGDAGLVEQILVNLVVNARDAMPGGGRLEIRVRAGPASGSAGAAGAPLRGEVTLDVVDTGCGMDPAVLARAFEPFFSTKPPEKGTGLGLSTVQQIVKQLSGRIGVESSVGRGTTFHVVLPAHAATGTAAAATLPEKRSGTRAGTETLLLVEDDALIRSSVRRHLSSLGYRVVVAANGHEALEIAASHPDRIDLLITDVVMPGMGGRELAQRLVARDAALHCVFMSAHPRELLVEQGRLDANTHYMEKPYDLDDLCALLRRILDA